MTNSKNSHHSGFQEKPRKRASVHQTMRGGEDSESEYVANVVPAPAVETNTNSEKADSDTNQEGEDDAEEAEEKADAEQLVDIDKE